MKSMKNWTAILAAAALAAPVLGQAVPKDELTKADAEVNRPVVAATDLTSPNTVAFRIRFGLKDKEPADWSGQATVSKGKVLAVSGWRWTQGDQPNGAAGWTVKTRRQQPQDKGQRQAVQAGRKLPINETGVIVRLADLVADADVTLDTASGKIAFKPSDVPYGAKLAVLEGAATIERVPAITPLAATTDDEDYPTAARAADGTVYVAYVSFTRGKDFQGVRERVASLGLTPENALLNPGGLRKLDKPEDFDYLRQPVGGERIILRAYKDGQWGEPINVTDANTPEVYRPAIAVDGTGKVWVFYSAHLNPDKDLDHGNWELLARPFDPAKGAFGDTVNVSSAPGTDFIPAATTDSAGRVWVTWVGARGQNFNVFTAHQTQSGQAAFTAGARVSKAAGNEWEPSIAADRNGNVSVAWDTYQKGDYDIYVARRSAGNSESFGEPQPVAASLRFEARPSLAYDAAGRLWVAWEESGDLWGKDFGALKKVGIPLYSGNRSLGVKVIDGNGQWFAPPEINEVIGGRSALEASANDAQRPNGRPAGAQARARNGTAPSFPRLTTDDQGQIWLAYRGRQNGNWRVGIGSVWFEFVTRIDGDKWLPPTWLPQSNNILDNRPAVVPAKAGGILALFSGDGRGELLAAAQPGNPHLPPADATTDATAGPSDDDKPAADAGLVGAGGNQNRGRGNRAGPGPDANNNLYVASLRTDAPAAQPTLTAVAAESPAKPGQDVADENDAVKAARDYRINLNGETLQLWRGEFHRHTELSPDGGGDGSLLDMWRYAIDAADFDWIGDGDHDYGNGREYSWWTTQKAVTLFTLPKAFTPVFSYERSVVYPEGHRNVLFARRGVRSLPRLPLSAEADGDKPAPDTQLLYRYLHYFDGICAAHTSATDMGTDWRNNDPIVEPFVEIYQGDRNNYERPEAPRSAPNEAKLKGTTPEQESIGGWRPKGFINLALLKGYRLAFQSSSDHISTHLSYCNVLVTDPSRQGILDAIKKRRVYGATDNIIADVRVRAGGVDHLFGEEFTTNEAPTINVRLIGAKTIANVVIIKDDQVVYSGTPNSKEVKFDWTDPNPTAGKTSYYYVRGQQVPDVDGVEGELVWVSPFWIQYVPR